MVKTVLALCGLSEEIHDRVTARSAKLFAPDGKLLVKPMEGQKFSVQYAQYYLAKAHQYIATLSEREPIEFLVLVMDQGDESTDLFCNEFFPFALIRRVAPFDAALARNGNEFNRMAKAYVNELITHSRGLRKAAAGVREVTTLHNTAPVLLPMRNFRSKVYQAQIQRLFAAVGQLDDPRAVLKTAISSILAAHPKVKQGREKKSYYSDGMTLFSVPGSARHAFFRPKNGGSHSETCLLSARTRLGGSYDPSFHFDCTAAKGGLAKDYPNCHDDRTPPAASAYVNIAPNDFVR